MKAALLACILATFAVRSCEAQQSRAQVSASVTIVEAIGVTTGATAVTQANGGTLDVTTPLSIRGSAPRVVQVVDGERARPISTQLRPSCPPAEGTAESCAIRSRHQASNADDSKRLLTYLVATVN
jgi:cell pole-organizing protein PopZ